LAAPVKGYRLIMNLRHRNDEQPDELRDELVLSAALVGSVAFLLFVVAMVGRL
jgi:hypothetical protein